MVGYQSIDIAQGYNMITPTFNDINATSYNIQNVKPSGENIGGWGDVNIQFIDDEGNWSDQYFWWTADMGAPAGVDGWYDGDNLAYVSIPVGKGFVLSSDEGAGTVIVSGAVDFDAKDIDMYQGYNGAGNSKPVPVDIQKIKPIGDSVGGWGDVNIQFIDNEGNWSNQYFYWTADMGAPAGVDGWYDGDTLVETQIQPGAGFVLSADEGNCKLSLPAIQ